MSTLGQDLTKLATLKDKAAELAKKAELARIEMKKWEVHCFLRMEGEESEGHRTRGRLFTPTSKPYAQVQDREEFHAWARDNEPELLKTAERDAELNALVRARLDDGEPLPPGLGFYTRDVISVRKA